MGEQEAVVCVRRSDWERVTEREELVGRLSFGSRFPQYFITAIFTGAVVLARWIFWSVIVMVFKKEERNPNCRWV